MFQKMAKVDEETSSEEVSKDMESDEETDIGSTDSESKDLIPTPSVDTGSWQETGDHRNSILSWQSHDISRPRNREESPKKEPKTKFEKTENDISLIPFGIYPAKYINMHLRNKQSVQKRNANQNVKKKEFLIDPDMFKEVLNHVRRMREKYSTMVEHALGRSKEFGKITSFTYPVFPSYDKDSEDKAEASKTSEDHNKTEGSKTSERLSKTPERHDKSMERPGKSPERHKTPERHDNPMEGTSKTPERSKSNDSSIEANKHQEPELDFAYEKRKDIFYKFLKMMMKKVKEIEDNENLAESPSVGVKTEKKVSFSNMNVGSFRKESVKLDSAVQTSNRNSNKDVQTDISKKKISKKKPSETSEISFVAKKPVFRPNSFKIPISSKSIHSKIGMESSKRASSKSYSISEVDGSKRPSSKTLGLESWKRNPGSPRKSDINITNIKLGNEDIVMRKKPNEAVIILGESGKKESVKISITTQGHEPESTKNKVSLDDVLMHIEDRILERFKTKKSSARRRSPYRETKSSVLKHQKNPPTDVSTSKSRKSSSIKWDKKDSESSKSDRKYSRQSDRKSSDRSRKDKKFESSSKSDNSRTKSSDRRSSFNSQKEKKSDSSSKNQHRPKSRFSSKDKNSSDSKTKSEYLRSKSSDRKSSEWSRRKRMESRSKSPERSSKTAKSTTDSLKSSLKKSSDGKYANKKSDLSRLYVLASPKTHAGLLAKSPKKSESTRQKSATTTSAEIADLSEDSTVVSEKSVRSKYKPLEKNPTKYFPRVSSPPGKSLELPEVPEEDHSEGKGAGLMKIAEPLNQARIRDVLVNGHRVADERQLKNAISAHVPVEIVDKRKKALPNAKILSYYEPEKAKAEEAKLKKPALKVKRKFLRPKVAENKQKNAQSTTVNLTDLIEKLALLEKAEQLLRQKENGKKKCWKY